MAADPPMTDERSAALQGGFASLIGEAVTSVWYVVSRPQVPAESSWVNAKIHEVDLDVELQLGARAVTVGWSRENLVEGLSVRIDDSLRHRDESQSRIDVSSLAPWPILIGSTIVETAVAWHITEDGCPESVWSVRIATSAQRSVVIALGELDDGPSYYPDALVVIFDESTARQYRPASSQSSAWGQVWP